MEQPDIPRTISVDTGVDGDEQTILWRIHNFPILVMEQRMINAQHFIFHAGDTIGVPSKWKCLLQWRSAVEGEVKSKPYVGIFMGIFERPAGFPNTKELYWEYTFSILEDAKGSKFYKSCSFRRSMNLEQGNGFGNPIFIDPDDAGLPLINGSLVIKVTFKLFSPTLSPATFGGIGVLLGNFQKRAKVKALAELSDLLKEPGTWKEIKIMSSDRKEFTVARGVLSARSPVFQAMLKSDMIEATTGLISIPDMGSKTMTVFLHFLCKGELLPEWRNGDVLLELTNVAAKYELKELLHFLDSVLGRVCDLDNVIPLMELAHRLSLKRAEVELLNFVRRKGTGSILGFFEMLKAISPGDNEAVPETDKQQGAMEYQGQDTVECQEEHRNTASTSNIVSCLAGDEDEGVVTPVEKNDEI